MRRIVKRRLDATKASAEVASPRHGAIVTFLGIVRCVHAGRRVKAVSYDCFAALAENELAGIIRQAEKRWPAKVSAAHRIGTLRVGEASVVVAAAAVHRAEAFAAGRWTIDEIKRRLPVWKKELYLRGAGRWLPGCSLHRAKR